MISFGRQDKHPILIILLARGRDVNLALLVSIENQTGKHEQSMKKIKIHQINIPTNSMVASALTNGLEYGIARAIDKSFFAMDNQSFPGSVFAIKADIVVVEVKIRFGIWFHPSVWQELMSIQLRDYNGWYDCVRRKVGECLEVDTSSIPFADIGSYRNGGELLFSSHYRCPHVVRSKEVADHFNDILKSIPLSNEKN